MATRSTRSSRATNWRLIEGDPYGAHGTTGERVPLAGATLLCPATPTKIVAMAVNYRSHGEPVTVPQPFLKAPVGADWARAADRAAARRRPGRRGGRGGRRDRAAGVADHGRRGRRARLRLHLRERCLGARVAGGGRAMVARQVVRYVRGRRAWIETDLDPEAIAFRARLNGEMVQDAHTSELVFGVRECVAFISQSMTLEPRGIWSTRARRVRRRGCRPGTSSEIRGGRDRRAAQPGRRGLTGASGGGSDAPVQ